MSNNDKTRAEFYDTTLFVGDDRILVVVKPEGVQVNPGKKMPSVLIPWEALITRAVEIAKRG